MGWGASPLRLRNHGVVSAALGEPFSRLRPTPTSRGGTSTSRAGDAWVEVRIQMQDRRREGVASARERGEGARCSVLESFAEGGRASIHLGRQEGARGFERPVAIKRLLGTFAHDPRFLAMFADAARVAQARGYVRERSSGIGEGRLSYMAPEQLGSSEVSRATDVYACGVMLWEMLGNRRLRSGRTPERPAAQILLATVPPPSRGAAGPIDPALEDVVRRATANNPSDRFASALEMAGRPAARARSRRWGVLRTPRLARRRRQRTCLRLRPRTTPAIRR